ncbi:MAG: hypothetical protein ACM37W_16895 [Actinomycetota bacterium]
MNALTSQPLILWRQVSGLAAVQGAITLSWMLYRIYLPQLLAGFGFVGWEQGIQILEDLLAVAIEPIAGGLSDRQRQGMGTRFPLIVGGVILASGLLILIPAIFIFGKPFEAGRWILPVMLIAWALAMAIFRAPVVSLLGEYAIATKLPQAMSLLIFVGGLAGAFRPIASEFILSLGPAITFAIGSFVLLGSVAVLRATNPDAQVAEMPANLATQRVSLLSLGLIAGAGVGIAWGTRLMMGEILPKVLKTQLPTANVKVLLTAIAIALAFASVPAGSFASQVGNQRAMLLGVGFTGLLLLAIVYSQGPVLVTVVVIGLIISYSLVTVTGIPFALSLVPPHRGGLGIGVYFGGFSLGISLCGVVLGQLLGLSLVIAGLMAAVAFLIAGICIAWKFRGNL